MSAMSQLHAEICEYIYRGLCDADIMEKTGVGLSVVLTVRAQLGVS